MLNRNTHKEQFKNYQEVKQPANQSWIRVLKVVKNICLTTINKISAVMMIWRMLLLKGLIKKKLKRNKFMLVNMKQM